MRHNVIEWIPMLDKQVAIRLDQSDLERLQALTKKIRVLSRNAIAREALRIGLSELEHEPARILRDGTRSKRGRRA
jgi:predicted DNA-binding protein